MAVIDRQNIEVLKDYDGYFRTELVTEKDWEGKKVVNQYEQVRIIHERLREFLSCNSSSPDYYGNEPTVKIKQATSEITQFEAEKDYWVQEDAERAGKNPKFKHWFGSAKKHPINMFMKFLNKQNKAIRKAYEKMAKKGRITFWLTEFHFRPGDLVCFKEDGLDAGGIVKEVVFGSSFMGPYLSITVQRMDSNGEKIFSADSRTVIPFFGDVAKLDDLPVQVITEDHAIYKDLANRGRAWSKMATNSTYLMNSSWMIQKVGWTESSFSAQGRVMVDISAFTRMSSGRSPYRDDDSDGKALDNIPGHLYFTAPATIRGFSFKRKAWGRFPVTDLDEIDFRNDAYDLLVLDQNTKNEVKSLVENSEDMFTDLISGKGGGAIFLLHGPPGLGKTLTAESVAEILHRPLYTVSVGELGITPQAIEENLSRILEMVTMWNAVLLLDEADIFLEARTKDDIARNAMVGVFLRLLEYHNGVMFLTTNRVANFDPAIISRISVIIQYPEFTTETRQTVWENILSSANIEPGVVDPVHMAKNYDINGRQIKNAIRIGLSLAQSFGEPLAQRHIEECVQKMVAVSKSLGVGTTWDGPEKASSDAPLKHSDLMQNIDTKLR